MNILKDGVNAGAHMVKDGAHMVKDGAVGAGHTLKSGYNNASLAKDKPLRSKQPYDADDEMLRVYEQDIKTAIKGLKFLASQTNALHRKYWPSVFRRNHRIIDTFIKLIGDDSLSFKGIDQYYQQFTVWQQNQILPKVHPKERQFLIVSICRELENYRLTMAQLEAEIGAELDDFQQNSLAPRIREMSQYLHDLLKLFKLRLRKKLDHEKLHKKIAKLMAKTVPLDEKETRELNSLDILLKQAFAKYTRVNDKLKLILPHAMAFLDEFLELNTNLLVCKQEAAASKIHDTIKYFSVFHGLNGKQYEDVVSLWERALDPVRLQLESSITIISNKNQDLIDVELDDTVQQDLALAKVFKKATHVLDKKNPVKPLDFENGMFHEHQAADPLAAYEKHKKMELNVPAVYNPGVISIDDVIVPHSQLLDKPLPGVPSQAPLPPLPARGSASVGTVLQTALQTSLPAIVVEGPDRLHLASPGTSVASPKITHTAPVLAVVGDMDEVLDSTAIHNSLSVPSTPTASSNPAYFSTPGTTSSTVGLSGTPVTTPLAAPPLPPRSHRPLPPVPSNAHGHMRGSPIGTPLMTHAPTPVFSPPRAFVREPVESSDDESNVGDDYGDSVSVSLASSLETLSSISSSVIDKSTTEAMDKTLVKIYNSRKNGIQKFPASSAVGQNYRISVSEHRDPILFDPTTSVSYRLWKFNEFFGQLEASYTAGNKAYVAVHDFKGELPGDLAFNKGEKLDVLFSFTDNHEAEHWLVGVCESGGLKRIGFVPSNYIEKA